MDIKIALAAQSASVPYKDTGVTATVHHTLDNPNVYGTAYNDRFGNDVDVCESYTIAGARREDQASYTSTGVVYIFNNNDGSIKYTIQDENDYSTPAGDFFGTSVGICEDYAIVGVPDESSAAGAASGVVYIYDMTDGSLLYTLDDPNSYGTPTFDWFGVSVAITASYAIVGSPYESGVPGNQDGDEPSTGAYSGYAHVFDMSDGSLLYTIANPNSFGDPDNDKFGWDVDICESYFIVGCPGSQDPSTFYHYSGYAYIYNTSNGAIRFTKSNPNNYNGTEFDYFGQSVAICESYFIVGAYKDQYVGGNDSGMAYIYNSLSGATIASIVNPNDYGTQGGDYFGNSVGICEDYAIVGAFGEDDHATLLESGKAYIFDPSDGALLYTLDNPNEYGTVAFDGFGEVVAISNNYAAVGVPLESDPTGTLADSGMVYIY